MKSMDIATNINHALKIFNQLEKDIREADSLFSQYIFSQEDFHDPSWLIESCYLQLVALTEMIPLGTLCEIVKSEYHAAKNSKHGYYQSEMGEDEPYSICLSKIRCLKHSIQSLFYRDDSTIITKDLVDILRGIEYVITKQNIYQHPPRNEADVHMRIEGILKPMFPDLETKPKLTKPIKGFEPDTGLPSLSTLIEYKFVSSDKEVKLIVDQILADTRGYTSKQYKNIIFIVYETTRFRREKEWNSLLSETGVSNTVQTIVLCGEPVGNKDIKTKKERSKKLSSKVDLS